MKMLRCSSTPDYHLYDAARCKLDATACAESVGLSRLCQVWVLKFQVTEASLGFACGLPCQHPSTSHHSIRVGNFFVHNVEHCVIQPRLQLCLEVQ